MKNKALALLICVFAFLAVISCGAKQNPNKTDKKILYYTDAMHPSVRVSVEDYNKGDTTCPICYMPLIPVFEEDPQSASTNLGNPEDNQKNKYLSYNKIKIQLNSRQEILADINTQSAMIKTIHKMIRTSGSIAFDERRVSFVSAYIGGRIEKLYVDFTGDTVYKGQALGKIYSPDLINTQEEYISALNRADEFKGNDTFQSLIDSARQRLKLWGVSDADIKQIEQTRKPQLTLTIYSPMTGVVIEKNVKEGEYIKEGFAMYKIANLSKVWMLSDIYEYELPYVKLGQIVDVTSVSFPGRIFSGKISFIDQVVNPQTRSLKVRVEINNSDLQLKPGMYVSSTLVSQYAKRLVVPKSALLDTGYKKVVFIRLTNTDQGGIYSPRLVETGISDDDVVEILSGLNPGDEVVTSGAFLLDSHAELSGLSSPGGYSGSLDVEKTQPAHQH